jgi:diacylglycerol kinase family enzyme
VGVYFRQAREVQIISREGKLPLDMDGELAHGRSLRFCVEPGALQMLL